MKDDVFLEDDEDLSEEDEEFASLTALPKKKETLEVRRKIEKIMELRRLKELDESIEWDDLE